MRLCSHVIKHDTGLAPNPFHGYCTSALCTPSHGKATLIAGDWLIGNSPKNDGNRLVYAMRVSEVLRISQYFHDNRFECKKPNPDGALHEQCGDNIYFKCHDDRWKRLPSRFHNSPAACKQDVGTHAAGHKVFIAERFYYFGIRRVPIPDELEAVIQRGRNFFYPSDHLPHLADDFVAWLEANYEPGVMGPPRDLADHAGETGNMITAWNADGMLDVQDKERPGCRPKSQSSSALPNRSRGCR